jgi:hypothetical protein
MTDLKSKNTQNTNVKLHQALECKDDKKKDDMHRDGNSEDKHNNSDKDIQEFTSCLCPIACFVLSAVSLAT